MNVSKARELRKNPTEAEQALWKHLRMRQLAGYKFRRQQPIGSDIVDFVSFERRVVVEVDGGQHSQQVDYDAERTVYLEAQGYQVLRFWNRQVLEEIEAVKTVVLKVLECEPITRHLNPPPQRGEENRIPFPFAGEGHPDCIGADWSESRPRLANCCRLQAAYRRHYGSEADAYIFHSYHKSRS